MCKIKIYTKLDVIAAFNQICIKKNHEWMTIFNTYYDQFEYLIMSFELCNALSNFQNYINEIIYEYFDVFCSVYLNDVLIYNNDENEHTDQMLKILCWLQEQDLYLNINKYEFNSRKIKYLDLIVIFDDVKINSKKVKTIQNWKISQNIKNMQVFLKFVNFYHQFIINFSQQTHFLIECSKSKVFLIRTEKQKIRYNLFTWITNY